jgi:hypothetical protein
MVESVVKNIDALLVVDETYYEFSKVTFVDMVHDHPNLAITRTMDKLLAWQALELATWSPERLLSKRLLHFICSRSSFPNLDIY